MLTYLFKRILYVLPVSLGLKWAIAAGLASILSRSLLKLAQERRRAAGVVAGYEERNDLVAEFCRAHLRGEQCRGQAAHVVRRARRIERHQRRAADGQGMDLGDAHGDNLIRGPG